MNIINTQKFKTRNRLTTEPIAMEHQPNKLSTPKHMLHIRTSADSLTGEANQSPTNYPKAQYKPIKSEIITLNDNKYMINQGKETINRNEDRKKRQFRFLKIDLSKQTYLSSNLANKSLSKQKNSSTDSLRIHKIKSIIGLDTKKEKRMHDIKRQPKAYRYQEENLNKSSASKSKQLLIKSINQRSTLKQKHKLKTIQIDQQNLTIIMQQFKKLSQKMQDINRQMLNHKISQKNTNNLHVISSKNKISAVNIINRFVKKEVIRIKRQSLLNILQNRI